MSNNKNRNFIPQTSNVHKNKNVKKKPAFYITLCLMIFWTIGSIFCIIATAKSFSSSEIKTVSADTVSEPTTYYSGEINYNYTGTAVQGWRFSGSGKATSAFGSPIRINFTGDSYFEGEYYFYFVYHHNSDSALPGAPRLRTAGNSYENLSSSSSDIISGNLYYSYYCSLNAGYSFFSLNTSIGTVWNDFDFYIIITDNIKYNKVIPFLYIQGAFNSDYDKGYENGFYDGMEQSATGISDLFTGSTVEYVATYGTDNTYKSTFSPDISGNVLSFGTLPGAPDSLKNAEQNLVYDSLTIYLNTSIPIDLRIFTFSGFPVGTVVTVVGTLTDSSSEGQYSLLTNSNNILYYFDYDFKPVYSFKSIRKIIIESSYYSFSSAGSAYDLLNYSLYSKITMLSVQPVSSLAFNDGYEKGSNDTRESLYNSWYLDRYNAGYNAGVESSSNHSFLSLMGAVVDAPIKALSGLLNFDVLGFNMLNFFYALCTCALIIAVVRMIL